MSMWISRDLYDKIWKSPNCFGNFIRDYFGFDEKKLSHWKILVTKKDYLIEVALIRNKFRPKTLFVLNSSGSSSLVPVYRYPNDPKWEDYYKTLDRIWMDMDRESLSGFFLSFEREIKLDAII